MTVTDFDVHPGDFDRRFHVELFIVHPTMAPSVITSALDLEPVKFRAVRERRTTPKGETLPGNYPDTRWRYSKKCSASHHWFAGELEVLVNRLEPHNHSSKAWLPQAVGLLSLFNF